MFLLGVTSEKTTDITTFVIIQKTQKKVKKHYYLVAVNRVSNDLSGVVKKIITFYNDKEYIINKRIFNQNGRPAKTVKAHPKILIDLAGTGADWVKELRLKKIPVEGFSINTSGDQKKKCTIGLGDDYYVPFHDLVESLLSPFYQNRLEINNKIIYKEKIVEILKSINRDNASVYLSESEYKDIIRAISIPVWFREKIRYSRRYAVNSKSRMTQI